MRPNRWVLGVLSSNQVNIAPFVHQMEDVCVFHLVEKATIFIIFELGTPSTSSIYSHPSTLAPCYWHSFLNLLLIIPSLKMVGVPIPLMFSWENNFFLYIYPGPQVMNNEW